MPTKTATHHTDPHARALVDELDRDARGVLVALFAALHNGPEWTLHVIVRKLRESAHPTMHAATDAMRRAVALDLVQRDGYVSGIGHALVELVVAERRDAKPREHGSRNCFAVDWYDDELDAEVRGYLVREHRINGGFRGGERCGRDSAFDYQRGSALADKLYAVVVP